jgi:DNA polymerase-3 subunit chi
VIVNFYHLTRSPLERVLPSICQSLVSKGERVLVVAGEGQLATLDQQLWTYAPDSFLPHGRDRPETQPVLLSPEPQAANGARSIALADGVWREEALGFERAYYLFDNGGLDTARGLWRALKAKAEVEPRYWKQDERGKWVEGP